MVGWLTILCDGSQPCTEHLLSYYLVDGHGNHIDVEVSKIAKMSQVLLYCLPPHALYSLRLQPCDVGLFKPLKSSWDKAVEKWETEHLGEIIDKYTFSAVFRTVWENAVEVSTLVNSFREAGIYPVNRSAIMQRRFSCTI